MYLRDQEWCVSKFAEILGGIDQQSFAAAWEGIVYFSRYLNKDVADVMAPIYLRAVTHLDWLEGGSQKRLYRFMFASFDICCGKSLLRIYSPIL